MRAPRKLAAPVLFISLLAAACGTGANSARPVRTPSPNADTTIVVVVDDFGKADDKSVGNADSNAGTKTDNCAYAGIPSNDVESYGGTNSSPPPPVSHGKMVASVLLKELTDKQGVAPDTIAPYGSPAIGYTGDAKRWVSDDLMRE